MPARTHGLGKTTEWAIWYSMISRCTKKHAHDYPRYGGRGITVCDRWRKFENFLADMGHRPVGLTLDRRDNDRGYEPDNCRWVTLNEQARNKSSTKLTPDLVREIRRRNASGESQRKLAVSFGVSSGCIQEVVERKNWKDIE